MGYNMEAVEVGRWVECESQTDASEQFTHGPWVALADDALKRGDPQMWVDNITAYFRRVEPWLNEALTLRLSPQDPEAQDNATELEKMAQQAICKALMASKAFAESAVRCFGSLPAPGHSSGYVEPWEGSIFDG